eukprot:Nitzschia sp. Nitz4//scaffold86_size83305//10004//12404//NITZ4_005250-RA/size83305-processed-gene-0.2-mRNA-1//1//CDS//3329559214//7784//frame0
MWIVNKGVWFLALSLLQSSVWLAERTSAAYTLTLDPGTEECFLFLTPKDQHSTISGSFDCIEDDVEARDLAVSLVNLKSGDKIYEAPTGTREGTFSVKDNVKGNTLYELCFQNNEMEDDEDNQFEVGFSVHIAGTPRTLEDGVLGPDGERALKLVEKAVAIQQDWTNMMDHYEFVQNREALHQAMNDAILSRLSRWTVSTLLSRLGGLYRDPARVDRDASSLLKSSVGVHLMPGIAPLVENNGDTSNCLVLQGTIAIVFRGNTYQLLVDIYLPPGYPIRPPVSYVRLAANMYLKENHPHVGKDGMVYLPYTHEWNARSHSLIEMVVAMSSVFSADPPVFTRPAPTPAPTPPPPPPPSTSNSSLPPPYVSVSATATTTGSRSAPTSGNAIGTNSSGASGMDSDKYMQDQIEAIMAREAAEANAAAEVARQAEKEEEEREKQAAAQKLYEERKLAQLKDQVSQKIQSHLKGTAQTVKSTVGSDWRDQQLLKASKETIDSELKDLRIEMEEIVGHIATVDTKTEEITQWLEENKATAVETVSVDDMCQPASKLHAQVMDLSAENLAITDALYFLDRGMYVGHMDCTTHLKAVRKLAKRQFLVRAHLVKINQVLQEGR